MTVGAARYSVPVAYVGQTVSVHEGVGHYEFFHQDRLIARHQKAARHSVVMEPAHYAGLLRPGGISRRRAHRRASIPTSAGSAR